MNREEAIEQIKWYFKEDDGIAADDVTKRAINMAIEALKSERPKGHWIPQNHNKTNGMVSTLVYYYPKCSVCGHCANYTNFCPNCGADMRGESDE